MRRNKYRVAPAEQRTWNGRTYASKAEMRRAIALHAKLESGELRVVLEQPTTRLGCPENVYRPDFMCVSADGRTWFEDVKGAETAAFKRNRKLWAAYGRAPLHIIKARGTEVLEGGADPCVPRPADEPEQLAD